MRWKASPLEAGLFRLCDHLQLSDQGSAGVMKKHVCVFILKYFFKIRLKRFSIPSSSCCFYFIARPSLWTDETVTRRDSHQTRALLRNMFPFGLLLSEKNTKEMSPQCVAVLGVRLRRRHRAARLV